MVHQVLKQRAGLLVVVRLEVEDFVVHLACEAIGNDEIPHNRRGIPQALAVRRLLRSLQGRGLRKSGRGERERTGGLSAAGQS